MSNIEDRARLLFPDLMPSNHIEIMTGAGPVMVPDRGEDFDIINLMNDSKDPDTGLLRDLKIDDRDLKQASSFYDYAFNIIGADAHPPWFMQMWTALMLFGEVCPVCSDKRYLDLAWVVDHVDKATPSEGIVDRIKPLRHGICPKCKRGKWELIQNHGLHNYTELVNVLGQRSGKSSSAAMMASYHLHRMLKFPKLAEMTKATQKSTELTATFVSLTFSKAEALLWTPFANIVNDSTWFKDYHAMLDHYGAKYGTELYRNKDIFIKYFHKGLKLYPTPPKSQTLRGDTRFMAIIDELGLFPLPTGNDAEDETSDRANADEAHKSLTNSLVTVQSIQETLLAQGLNCPPALMIGVSSPISIRDKVMRRLADSRTDEGRKYILGVNLPTWKVNPTINRDTPIIMLAYASNAEKAERDFGANPPRVHSTFIKANQVPHSVFKVPNSHILKYQYDQPGLLYAKVERHHVARYPSVVCIDAGSVNNSFCLSGAHFDFKEHKTVVSTVLEIMPHNKLRIVFNLVYENVILPVLKDLNGVVLLADQWQSLDILSRARADMGLLPNGKPRCVALQYSPKRRDFDSLVSMTENGAYEYPFLSAEDYKHVTTEYIEFRTLNGQPVKHLLLQMLTVQDVGETRAPEKGDGFTDDIFRSLVLTTKIHNEKIMERLKNADLMVEQERRVMPKPLYVSRGH